MHEDGPLARHIEQHVEGTIGELKKVDGQIRLRLVGSRAGAVTP
jgi:hypothetical protein